MNWPEAFRRVHRLFLSVIVLWCTAGLIFSPWEDKSSLGLAVTISIAGLACSCRPIEDPRTDRQVVADERRPPQRPPA